MDLKLLFGGKLMDWKNWQGNIESIFNYFLGFSQPLLNFGPLTRDLLIKYCKSNYKKLDESFKFDLNWNYSDTWNNTYLPAMFKLGLLQEQNGYIFFTEAGKQLATFQITGTEFFKRQLIEYQYVNPYQDNSIRSLNDCNLFPYWFLLKLLNDLEYLTYNEAVYIVLKIPKYDSQIYTNTVNSILKLREIENTTSSEELDDALKNEFGEKISRAKAWQYERNFLKWTGFCIEESNKTIKIDSSKKYELTKIVNKEPLFINFIDKSHYSKYFGRSFNINYYYIQEDEQHILKSKSNNEISLEVSDCEIYNPKDIILFSEINNNYALNDVWSVSDISYSENNCLLTLIKIKELDNSISKNIFSTILGG